MAHEARDKLVRAHVADSCDSHAYPELIRAMADMQAQHPHYRPTSFWDDASRRISEALCTNGVEQFRRLPESLQFFVPTYGPPGNGFSTTLCQQLTQSLPDNAKLRAAAAQYLSGHAAALADYRVLQAADLPEREPYLRRFSESSFGSPVEQFEFDGRRYSRSALNYLLGLAMLKRYVGNRRLRTVIEIGGGFGTLGEILCKCLDEPVRYIDLDIPPVQFVAECYLSEVLGSQRVSRYAHTAQQHVIDIDSLRDVSTLCSWQIERLRGRADLFVNFISFQEMEPEVVQNYLEHIDRLQVEWILLRNMREGKQLKCGTEAGVRTPIKSPDYLAMLPNYALRASNVLPFGYRTVDGYHSELLVLQRC